MKRWSKIRSRVEALFDPRLRLRLHCAGFRYEYGLRRGGPAELGRYWFTLDGDVLWDFPRQFVSFDSCHMPENESASGTGFPYSATDVSAALREYLDTPVETLLSATFEHDKYGACELLRAADRRLGVSRLAEHYGGCDNQAVEAILTARGAR